MKVIREPISGGKNSLSMLNESGEKSTDWYHFQRFRWVWLK